MNFNFKNYRKLLVIRKLQAELKYHLGSMFILGKMPTS